MSSFSARIGVLAATVSGLVLFGCGEFDFGDEDSGELDGEETALFYGGHHHNTLQILIGRLAFNHGRFRGNGRTCATCHPSRYGESGTLNPAEVEALFQANPYDPLFQHDGADVIGGDTFDRIREHATVLIERSLPSNARLVGSNATSVILARGIPTTMNTPALDPVLMVDGREPDLQTQALNAALGHAQARRPPSNYVLDAIAAFQRTLFNRANLEDFADDGVPLTLPYGNTESEQRGRRFFIADNSDDPDMVGESPVSKCGWCHSGPMLDGASAFFAANIAPFPATEGLRFTTALVSEINPLGLPVDEYEFTLPDGTTRIVSSPDPGIALNEGVHPNFVGFFKSPTVWGITDTAPYFHDNSAKTLEELMDHYDLALFLLSSNNPRNPPIIDLTEEEKADIAAYMRLL